MSVCVCACVLVFAALFPHILNYIISYWPLLPLDNTHSSSSSADNSNKLVLVQLKYKYIINTRLDTTCHSSAPLLPWEGQCQTFQLWNSVYRQENPRGGWQLQKSNWFQLTVSAVSRIQTCGLHNNRPLNFWSKMSPEGVESVQVTTGSEQS